MIDRLFGWYPLHALGMRLPQMEMQCASAGTVTPYADVMADDMMHMDLGLLAEWQRKKKPPGGGWGE